MSDSELAALLRERRGYEAKGRPERAAQVDAEIARRGVRLENTSSTPPEKVPAGPPERTPAKAPETTKKES